MTLEEISKKIVEEVGNKKVFLLVSGGVDSTVVFVLLNKVLGCERVLGVHINSGLMRLDESSQVLDYLKKEGMNNLQICDAESDFLSKLKGVTDPEKKRNIIGVTFLEVKDREMQRLALSADEWMIAQGTIYPDTLETGETKNSDFVKTHHNRVKEILDLQNKGMLLEPLASLYKDEVRALGEELGIPRELVWRHPFPGPGLGVRLLCSDGEPVGKSFEINEENLQAELLPIKCTGVKNNARSYAQPLLIKNELDWQTLKNHAKKFTEEHEEINRCAYIIGKISDSKIETAKQYCEKSSLDKLRIFDNICTKFLFEHELYNKIWQMPVVLLPLQIEGKPCVLIRPINSTNAMTATVAELDQNLLRDDLWNRLKAAGAGALFCDITDKPPATIEWE